MNYDRLRDSIRRHEGLRLRPYHDPLGVLTIGYGRNLDAVGISEDEADYLLDHDIHRAIAGARTLDPWLTLSPRRREVLVELVFNLGLGGVRGFRKMLAALEAGDYRRGAAELLNSRYARQVGPRADELARRLEEDD